MKTKIPALLSLLMFVHVILFWENHSGLLYVNAKEDEEISALSACLMEVSTGQIIYEKDADTPRPPASVTKIMTMLLIFDALDAGKIKSDDIVSTSEYAASMGGSQVFLEPGETQSVDTLLKCISVASANDACVAMAEYISGSEEEFVKQMNERAKGLGMENTSFVNCNGLDEAGHMTSARDIALMSRELLLKYPKIHEYCTIWMEDITHKTKKGDSQFGLTNTNKLIRQYPYATGLKTGSTGLAGFCLSASAKKNDIELVAVIMAAENSKIRFREATKLLNKGFSVCTLYEDKSPEALPEIKIKGGIKESVPCEYENTFRYVDTKGINLSDVTKHMQLKEYMDAPVKKGDNAGKLIYQAGGDEIGAVNILISKDVQKASFIDCVKKALVLFLL